jgi:serine/threonine protein kinase
VLALTGRRVRPVMGAGDVLAGRYRLVAAVAGDHGEPAEDLRDDAAPRKDGSPATTLAGSLPTTSADPPPATLWRAVDEVLARPVAVKVLRALGAREAAAAQAFLAAAATAGRLSHPVLARVYDAALEERPAERYGRPAGSVDVAYVVSEWIEGRPLDQLLREDGPVAPRQACALAVELAEALALAHARGVGHGRLHPGNVLLTPGGRPKITDLAVAAALHGRDVRPGEDGQLPAAVVASDTRDLAATLYALLTARWPSGVTDQPAGRLVPAPGAAAPRSAGPAPAAGRVLGRVYSPRQVRAGVPGSVDLTVARALEPARHAGQPPLRTPADLGGALVAAVGADYPVPVLPVPREPQVLPRVRRLLPLLSVLLLLLTVGTGGYLLGMAIGEVKPERDPFGGLVQVVEEAPEDGGPADPAADARVDLAGAELTDFDPPPGGGDERPETVPNAVDDDASTAWTTERYASSRFGGLKQGVGLLVDLGSPTAVSRVEVALTSPGVDLQLRAADAAGSSADDFPVLAEQRDSETLVRLAPPTPVTARYWLVWLTGLPADGDRFAAGISELAFVRG